jgi:uncharacterized lipoprotein YddW (UPF0748 family)
MPTFPDIQGHWSQRFIEALTDRGIISGFPDGTFQPDRPLSRAQFAALIAKAFDQPKVWENQDFADVPSWHWAAPAIRETYESGFLSGYPNRQFRPDLGILRIHALLALINGLDWGSDRIPPADLPKYYDDASAIPSYAINQAAAATKAGMIANYPQLRRLRPNDPATRGEIAVTLYQTLRPLRGWPAIDSPYLVQPETPPPASVTVSHQREFRGAWIACVWNINWPSKPGLPSDQQQAELIRIFNDLQAANFNAVILQIRPEGDALYRSDLEPWSRWLTGTQGRAPSPYYDPLEFAIAEAHKRNLELHAWFNPYRARSSTNSPAGVAPHAEAVFPHAVYTYGTLRWMDPGRREIQDRTYEVILDVVRRYDIDGVHLDDYFYPYPVSGVDFPDLQTYYERGDGRTLEDWRRFNVNSMVSRIAQGIGWVKPYVRFGISPFGIYRPGEPEGIRGLDQYATLFADPKKWLAEGWLDYVAPQLYWPIQQTAQSYPKLLDWWTSVNVKGTHVYVGNNLAKLGSSSAWTIAEFEQQIALSRSRAARKSLGNIFYHTSPLVSNQEGVRDRFRTNLYATPALPPVLKPVGNPPAQPVGLTASGQQLRWSAATANTVRGWSLYRKSGSTWILDRLLPRETTTITVNRGTYALCTVDRSNRESTGLVITV